MANVYSSAQSERGKESTKAGAKHIHAHTRTWNLGASVTVTAGPDGRDLVEVSATRGSNDDSAPVHLFSFGSIAEAEEIAELIDRHRKRKS